MSRLAVTGLCLMALSLTGCTSTSTWNPTLPWMSKKPKLAESEFQTPGRMAAIWTPDVMLQPDGKSTRGFGGRFYFYNARNESVPVEGQLVVYAYDDTDESQTTQVPTRKYAFTPEQFTQHFSRSALGASYSVWLSWDEAGGDEKTISLMPVLTTTTGHVVMGQQALNVLPGKKVEVPVNSPWGRHGITHAHMTGAARTPSAVVGAGYSQQAASQPATVPATAQLAPTNDASQPQGSVRTTTIALPRSLRARLNEQGGRNQGAVNQGAVNQGAVNQGAVNQGAVNQRSGDRPLGTGTRGNAYPTGPQPAMSRQAFAAQNNARHAALQMSNAMAAAASRDGLQSAQPTAHFGRPQSQAPASPNGQPDPALEANQRNPSERRSALPWLHRRNSSQSGPATWSNAGRTRG